MATELEMIAYASELTTRLRQHVGEFVLVVRNKVKVTPGSTSGCFGGGGNQELKVRHYLGIIDPCVDELVVDLTTDTLPTRRYVSEDNHGPIKLSQGGLLPYDLIIRGIPLVPQAHAMLDMKNVAWVHSEEPLPEIEIVVGDEAVARWFNPTDETDYWLARRRSSLWFEEAAELLGRPLATTPKLDAKRENERERLKERLWELQAEMAPYMKELDAIRRASQTSGVLARSGGASLCEDQDDVIVHSIGPLTRLGRAMNELRRVLTEAEDLGLGDHPYVTAFKLRYPVR